MPPSKGGAVLESYEIVLAGERIAVCEAPDAQIALLDHLRTAGCVDAEIVRLGADSVAWRGAVYRARPCDEPASASAVDAGPGRLEDPASGR
jgi:hypothetical protein